MSVNLKSIKGFKQKKFGGFYAKSHAVENRWNKLIVPDCFLSSNSNRNVFFLHKRNNIYMSFIVQKFISDGMTAGKSDIFLRNIFLGFLSLKKLTRGSISLLLFILLQKNLLPYQILFVKRGNKKISKSVAISLQRQLVLSKKLYITLLREIKFESLAGRIPRQFFDLFRGNLTVISRHLKKRYGE